MGSPLNSATRWPVPSCVMLLDDGLQRGQGPQVVVVGQLVIHGTAE
ncbi:hypothetical protein ACWGII_09490 [Streptomyces sp. NPDC054855]